MTTKIYPFVYSSQIRKIITNLIRMLLNASFSLPVSVLLVPIWIKLCDSVFAVKSGEEGSIVFKIVLVAGVLAIFVVNLLWITLPLRKQYTALYDHSLVIYRNMWFHTQLRRGFKDSILYREIKKVDTISHISELKDEPLPAVVSNPEFVVRIWTKHSADPYYVITDRRDEFISQLELRIDRNNDS